MKRLPKLESVWGKIATRAGSNYVITFNVKDNLYRIYCIKSGEYRFLDKSSDAIKLLQNQKI